ncbi:MAG: NTP transferase domain-containing protein [Elusimicrobia bacterium]|nr:NTP transferase domain-containing protein [Candidatus Obscuribacterium magneticum]
MKKKVSSDVLGVIPARYGSTRFPGKPLVKILGQTMVERVYRAAKKALSHVLVATDDSRIVKAVRRFGGEAILTPNACGSGTERMAYVAGKSPARYVNIGDEPLMHPTP